MLNDSCCVGHRMIDYTFVYLISVLYLICSFWYFVQKRFDLSSGADSIQEQFFSLELATETGRSEPRRSRGPTAMIFLRNQCRIHNGTDLWYFRTQDFRFAVIFPFRTITAYTHNINETRGMQHFPVATGALDNLVYQLWFFEIKISQRIRKRSNKYRFSFITATHKSIQQLVDLCSRALGASNQCFSEEHNTELI